MHSVLVGAVIAMAFSGSRGEEGGCLDWVLRALERVDGHEIGGGEG